MCKYLIGIFFILCFSFGFSQVHHDSIVVHFGFNDSEINEFQRNKLTKFLANVSENVEISIAAYTDTIGAFDYNKELASKRLENAKVYCEKFQTIDVIHGESSKFALEKDNRIVVIKVLEKHSNSNLKMLGNKLVEVSFEDTLKLNIEFFPGTAIIKEYSYVELEKLRRKINESEENLVEIHGHVCCADEMPLSEDRAVAVKSWLLQKRIDDRKIKTFGHSNYQPLVPEISEENMQKNRRVEILIYRIK